MAVRVRITPNGIIEEKVTDDQASTTTSFELPVSLASETSTTETITTLTTTGQFSASGSIFFPVAAATQVLREPQDPSWTTVDVTNKVVVPVSASVTGGYGGFTTIGATDGQMCFFVNTGPKPLRIAGLADGTYPAIPVNSMFQALRVGSSWYKMSGSY